MERMTIDKQKAKPSILIVDNNPVNIDVLVDILREDYSTKAATNGEAALEIITSKNPPDIILLDIMMPGMDGYQICHKLKQNEITRRIPVIFVTALGEAADEAKGLETGAVDYIRKPVDPVIVKARIRTHLALKNTRSELQQLLDKTLSGSIKTLSDILSLAKPDVYSKVTIIQRHVKKIIQFLNLRETWQYELAAMLSHIGFIILPDNLINKVHNGDELTLEEQDTYMRFPQIGYELVSKIPRLDRVAEMIKNQLLPYSKIKTDQQFLQSRQEILGAHILKVVNDYHNLTAQGITSNMALKQMSQDIGDYEPTLVRILRDVVKREESSRLTKEIRLRDMRLGMIIDENLYIHPDGQSKMLLLAKGAEISSSIISRLQMLKHTFNLDHTIRVLIPKKDN